MEQGTGHTQWPTDIPLLQITTLSWLLQATLLADRHLDITLFGLLLFSINIVVRSIKRLQFKIQIKKKLLPHAHNKTAWNF